MRTTALSSVVLTLVAHVAMAEWSQFRGPNSAGVATGPPPVQFGPGKNELWRVPMASGHSSPCVFGDSIFLTTYDQRQKKLAVVCIERSRGRIGWQTDVPTDQIEKGHPSFNPASSTPACDGERVVAYFGSFGLICLEMSGRPLWEVRMPLAKSFAGSATSPAIVGDQVILYRGTYVDHFLLAVDKQSGKELWRVPQAEQFTGEMAFTACPIVADDRLIVHTARSLQAFDVSTGKRVWVAKCATTATSTPVLAGNEVIVAAWNKMGEPSLILTCLEVKTGRRVYRMRTGGRGTHYASPLIAGGKIYTIAGDGRISVLTLGANPELLATNDMQEGVYATPAIFDGTIYVRTHSALFAFREP